MSDRLVFDPRPAMPAVTVGRAPRLETLDGAVIALVDNGKVNARQLLGLIVEELTHRWSPAGFVHLGPPSRGHGGEPSDAEVAAEWATAAVAAVGDCGSCTA